MATTLWKLDAKHEPPVWRPIGTGDLAYCRPGDRVRLDGHRGESDFGAREAAVGAAVMRGVLVDRRVEA